MTRRVTCAIVRCCVGGGAGPPWAGWPPARLASGPRLASRTAGPCLERQGCGQSPFCCSRGCCEAEDGEEQVVVVFGFADGGGDPKVLMNPNLRRCNGR